jgi:TP901 family phage tail tape measure protein
MAIKTIETKAIISAQDKTGATFAEIAQKLKNMEGVAKRASQTAGYVSASVGSNLGGISTRVRAVAKSIDAASLAIAGLAVVGVEKLAKLAESVIDVGVEFDKLTRRQQAVLNISGQQQKPLLEQATILGGTTPFKKLEVIEAQTELAKRGIPLDAIGQVTDAAAKYAQAQGVGLPEAAKLLEAAAFAEGKRGASPAELAHIADRLVKASQISGMGAGEMEEFIRGGAAEAAGVGMPFLMAQGAAMHLAHIPDPGAAAVRFASQLSKPTPAALDAFGAMGIRYQDFVKAGTGMQAGNLSSEFESELGGRKLSGIGLAKVQAVLSNKAIAGDEQKLSKALLEILQAAPKKSGGKSPDAAAISKVIKKFWDASIESVDVEGLERALLKKGISGAQAVEIFGKRGGLAFKALSEHAGDVSKFEKEIKSTPEGLAAREAEKQMGGLAGAKIRMEGGWQNVLTSLAKDNERWLTPLYNAGSRLENVFVDATSRFRLLTEGVSGAIAAVTGFGAVLKVLSFLGVLPGGSAAAGMAGLGAAGLAGGGAYEFFKHVPMAEGGDSYGLSHPDWHPGMPKESTRFGGGPNHWLGGQPPEAGKFSPGGLGAFRLEGAATIKNSLSISLDPGIIAKEIRNQLDAGGNLRADTGVSMSPSNTLPR